MIQTSAGGFSPNSPYLKPLDAQVLGGLRNIMIQSTDGYTTILRPKLRPTMSKKRYSYIIR